MAYSDFTLDVIKSRFGIQTDETHDLFSRIKPVRVPRQFQRQIQENTPLALAIHTEKARSELIVMPVLVECRKLLKAQISLFSGIELNVDPHAGLKGTCDFVLSRSNEQLYLTDPVAVIVEAKKDSVKDGMGQCVAEMVAARMFNEQRGNDIRTIFGAVTTGSIWQFLKLNGDTAYIDRREYYLNPLGKILGILSHMALPEGTPGVESLVA